MRDLLMLGVMVGMVPMAFMNGFVAFLLWTYTSVLAPHVYMYGFMIGFRYAFVFAALALGALVLGRVKDRGRFLVDAPTVLIMAFIAHASLSALFAMQPNFHIAYRQEFLIKGMALALAAPFFVTSRWRIHLILVVLVAGLGFHGIVDGLKVIVSGGGHTVKGIPNSTLSDNNLFALGMVMLLPLCLYLAKYSEHRVARWASLATFGLCVMAVLGSDSRGGFLALAILGFWYWVTSPRKLVSAMFVAIIAVGIVQFAPERWFERIETIKDADSDQSFLGRVSAWKVSVNIANDHPIFGGGFDATQIQWIWEKYKDKPNFINIYIGDMGAKAAHSNYFQVLGDLGYVGLLIFLALLASAFATRRKIRRLAARDPTGSAWAVDLSTAITLSLVAFMAGGAGVSLAYFELMYLLIVILSIVRRVLEQQVSPPRIKLTPQRGKSAHV